MSLTTKAPDKLQKEEEEEETSSGIKKKKKAKKDKRRRFGEAFDGDQLGGKGPDPGAGGAGLCMPDLLAQLG